MAYSVVVDQFEGPLDLLVQLVERNQLEITAISAATVTEQFLAHLERLPQTDPAELTDFLHLASRLVYIKSLALLPNETAEEGLDELRALDRELATYRRYLHGAKLLQSLSQTSKRSWGRPATKPAQRFSPPELGPQELAAIFQQTLATVPQPVSTRSWDDEVTIEDMQERITSQIRRQPAPLHQLVAKCRDRREAIVLFLALLELVRQSVVAATQDKAFGPAMVVHLG